jgi:hypothetical protein
VVGGARKRPAGWTRIDARRVCRRILAVRQIRSSVWPCVGAPRIGIGSMIAGVGRIGWPDRSIVEHVQTGEGSAAIHPDERQ